MRRLQEDREETETGGDFRKFEKTVLNFLMHRSQTEMSKELVY